ncbi:MAG TPA: LytTR family DNA-binding domain-containing protein [Gemmatimonadaceae bacterium]|jgi:two-component system LytT family response regulator
MLRIVIADDEAAARRRLRRLLGTETNCSIVGEFADGASAVEGIQRLAPDVALLDIEMPERDGLSVASAVNAPDGPAIVFITAFDHYALRAFDVHATDYLVKPIDAGRLHDTLARVAGRRVPTHRSDDVARLVRLMDEMRATAQQERDDQRRRTRDRLLVALDGRSIVVPTSELDWIEAAGNYVRLHRGANAVMMREPLASIETSIDPNLFVRIHRGAIVNIARIKEVQPWFSGAAVAILTTGQRLTISRSHRRQFEARFGVESDDRGHAAT